jgi:mono/diheme cytochrome c family protein
MTRAALVLLTAAVTTTLAGAAIAADADHGETIAKRWCAACHVVSTTQKSGSTQAPPFSEIAKRPGFDAAQLALRMLMPHPRVRAAKRRSRMPDLRLSRDEAADLAAYIATQR